MNTLIQTLKRNAYGLAALLLVAAMVVPTMLAGSASAALITSRSLTMSNATPSASSVTYDIKFTTGSAAVLKYILVDICDSGVNGNPIIGNATCNKPAGITVGTTVGTTTGLPGTWTATTILSGRVLVLSNASNSTSVGASTAIDVPVSGFVNPSTTNHTFYGRILTYTADPTGSYGAGTPGSYTDAGSVAMSTSSQIGVTATVVETLTFCVSAANPGVGCTSTTAPNITLGHGPDNLLDTTAVDTSTVYFQTSTNSGDAAGTSVRAKGSANLTSGTNTIPGQGATANAFSAGSGKFGFYLTGGTGSAGSNTMSPTAPYDTSGSYALDSTTGGATGDNVTGTYGDTIASGVGVMIDAENVITFGATAAGNTAAGVYTAAYSLIATPSY